MIAEREQLLNGKITNVTTNNLSLNGNLNTKITDWFSVTYKNQTLISNSVLSQQVLQNIQTQKHSLQFDFYPSDNTYIGIDGELFRNDFSTENQENYFLNLVWNYTFEKKGIDLQLNWNNMLNTKEFTSVYNSTFSYIQNTYQLRPSQVVLKIKFSFK